MQVTAILGDDECPETYPQADPHTAFRFPLLVPRVEPVDIGTADRSSFKLTYLRDGLNNVF